MGVTYKLRDEVVHFIINERQSNPLFSCRQLAESASQKFGLHLSKSSVHDVLRESGIVTPRGRKPKNKFEIPRERKNQIQGSLSQIKLLAPLPTLQSSPIPDEPEPEHKEPLPEKIILPAPKEEEKPSPEYEGAGKIFQKALLWDLGIFSEENIKASDWGYYLTYCKGIKVFIENNKDFFIELPLPIERCIREVADGIINNIRPLIVQKISDETLFRACMEAQAGFKIQSISIVGQNDHILELSDIMELNRSFMIENRVFVENNTINFSERLKSVFFPQVNDSNEVINNILNLRGFDNVNSDEYSVTLVISKIYDNISVLQEAVEKLNAMYLRDENGRLLTLKIQELV